jgi:hypothetical protein
MCPHVSAFMSACVCMCPHVSAKNADSPHLVIIRSTSDPARHFYTRYTSTNNRSRMSTGGRSVCSHSSGRTGSGRSTGSYSRRSQATAPSAVTSPRGRGSPVSTGGRSVCSHSSGRTGSGRSTGSYSRGSQATAPSAVTSPRGRGSPVSTGGRSVCSHSSGRT